ncbi:MAG: hypothetical protein G01um101470_688, partial [Parcubacteria group bacterium Gr01-1014_70]
KDDKLHLVEVKTLSWDSTEEENTERMGRYRPEDNMHPQKLKRLARVTESYLSSKRRAQGMPWQFDVAAVFLDMEKKQAKIKMLLDLILPAR